MATKKILLLVFVFLGSLSFANAQKSSGDESADGSALDIFIPNAFTPNSDGLNDSFRVVVNGPELDLYELMVLDRNGKEVFYTTNPTENWDGTIKGSSYSSAATMFIYILKIKSVDDRGPQTLRGHIVMIR